MRVVIEHAQRFHDVHLPDVISLDELRVSIRKENENYWAHIDHLTSRSPLASVIDAKLAEREREIVAFVVHGFTNNEIAKRLHISTRTVSTHLVNIYQKLNVHSRTALVALVRAADHSLEARHHSADVAKFGPFIPPESK
ncbi:MAG TPA: LuxR C-terminal-related transcriptional regulator [Limnochordia bacterium]|nr:LuxR C-terminal-related transcriptional regulator [Limnochordia bacterium]